MSDAIKTIVVAAAEFAEAELTPNGASWERDRHQPADTLRRAIKAFTPVGIPTDLGGQGLGLSAVVECYEVMAARDLGFTCALAVHNAVTAAVAAISDQTLRQRYLPQLISGEAIGAFSLTEPHAGSDAGAIKCRAEATDDGYRLNGDKAWVTNGCNADVFLSFVQADATKRTKGIVGLVVDREAAGLQVSPPLDLFGSHAMGTTDLSFSDTAVPQANIAFPEGQGFSAAMSGLNVARIGVAAMCNGALAGALALAVRQAKTRFAFGQCLYDNQGIQFPLADTATALEASRALTRLAATAQDAGEDATVAAAHAKKFATQAAFDGISQCLQIFGANGLKEETGLARQLASARVCAFMDGTSEIQNLVIARTLATQFANPATQTTAGA